jgi:hypothetical protein
MTNPTTNKQKNQGFGGNYGLVAAGGAPNATAEGAAAFEVEATVTVLAGAFGVAKKPAASMS